MNKQHGLLFKMLCICLATVLMVGSTAVVSFAEDHEHTFANWVDNGNGTHTGTCTVDGCTEKLTEQHADYMVWAPTENNGDNQHTGTCDRCAYTETKSHAFDQFEDNLDDTHSAKCSTCNYVKAEKVSHRYKTDGTGKVIYTPFDVNGVIVSYTCTCEDCGHQEACAHEGAQWIPSETNVNMHTRTCATCGMTEEGYHEGLTVSGTTHSGTCSVCGKTDISIEGHQFYYTHEDGNSYHTETCGLCGLTRKVSHQFTYTDKNSEEHTGKCVCGEEYIGYHNYSFADQYCKNTKPTCTSRGIVEKTCTSCGHKKTERYGSVLGHDYKWKVTKNRTLFTPGEKTWTCWRCGDKTDSVKTEKIPSIMEDIGAWIVGAFGFAGHVAYEPIRWIVKLFYNPVEKDA